MKSAQLPAITERIRTATACAATAGLAFALIAAGTAPAHASAAAPPTPPAAEPAAPKPVASTAILGANPATVTSDLLDVPSSSSSTAAAAVAYRDDPAPSDQSTWRALATQAGRPMAAPNTPVRWDPCTTITWTFDNPSWAEDLPNARASIRQMSGATGLKFREVGPKQTAALHIKLVDFTKLFPRSWRGHFAAAEPTPTKPSQNTWWAYMKATIYLNSWRFHQNDNFKVMLFEGRNISDALHFQTRKHRQHIILHELGHVLGLHHTNWWAPANRTSVMATGVDSLTFTPGDLAGLRAIGARAGCHSIPAPVRVATGIPAPTRAVTAVQITTPVNPVRTFINAWLCTGATCTRGSRGANPNAPGAATWRFAATCTLAPRTLKVVTESRYHTRTVTSTVRAGCPPAPPTTPVSGGWTRGGTALTLAWTSTSDSADIDAYSYRISGANNPTRMPTTWTTGANVQTVLTAAKPGATYTVETKAHNVFGYSPVGKLAYVTTVGAGTALPVRTATSNGAVTGRVTVNATSAGTLKIYGCASTTSATAAGETVAYPKGTTTVTVGGVTDRAGTICVKPSTELTSLTYLGLTGAGTWTTPKPVALTRTVKANTVTPVTGGAKNAALRLGLTLTATTRGTLRLGACTPGAPTATVDYPAGTTRFDLLTTTGTVGTVCVKTSTAAKLVTTIVGRGTKPGTLTSLFDTRDTR